MIFNDNYELISGWIHDFYCDKDGSELTFDLHNNQYFKCPKCHYKYTDEKRKRAWITKYRYNIFNSLESYSKKYLETKDKELLNFIISALNYYSLNYDKFAVHNKNGQIFDTITDKCGRITSQGLNEAMISIKIVNCLDNISSYLNKETLTNVLNLLFPKIYNLLKPQINKIHNINCYEICSLAMMGIISHNKEMIEFAFNSPYSFYNQLDKGLTKDYFWFEGSFHYHFFVLEPILNLLKLSLKHQFNIPKKYYDMAKEMLKQGYKLSFSDCSLPSPNDGWPNRNLLDYIDLFILGNEIFDNEFNDIIKDINNKNNSSKTIHSLNTGFSILKNQYWNIFIKYQENNLNHAHPDKLNIEIKCGNNFLTHDLSTSGYGSIISNEFYKKTYAHNTIVINGQNSNLSCQSIVSSYNENMLEVLAKNIYDNVNISRKIELLSNELADKINVEYKGRENIDYLFHCDALLISKLKLITKEDFKEYPYFTNIKEVITELDEIELTWKLSNKKLISKINLKDKQLFICNSPDNPNLIERTTLIIRSSNINNPSFNVKWKILNN